MTADFLLTLSKSLAEIRKAKGWSVPQLSKRSGLNARTLRNIENGRAQKVLAQHVVALAQALSVSTDALLCPNSSGDSTASRQTTEVVHKSEAMKRVLKQALDYATTSGNVLITGETGTGKNLLAQKIHDFSGRQGRLFQLNCAALPQDLIESELFGHVRGAFTGAQSEREGAFGAAAGGTLVLDEISDVPMQLQGKLLKAVETKEVKPLGSDRTYRFDVRIISLSNRAPALLIDERRFRLDLFYRISSLRIHIPALRERLEDIDLLADYFMRYDADRLGLPHRTLTPEAMAALKKYSWPGNVRELESFLDLLMITTQSDAVEAYHVMELLSEREMLPRRYDDAHGVLKSEVIPYYFGPAVQDPARFYGRNREIETLLRKLRQARSKSFWHLAVIGDHRLGKSSLLRVLNLRIAAETNSISVFVDLAGVDPTEFFKTILSRVAEAVFLKSPDRKVTNLLSKAKDLGEWKNLLNLDLELDLFGMLTVKKTASNESHWAAFRKSLSALWQRLQDFGNCDGIVVILDEVSSISRWPNFAAILRNWRSLIQEIQGYNFVVADAYPLYQLSEDQWSPFFNVFNSVRLQAMNDRDAEELIVRPAETVGVTYELSAIQIIKHLSGKKPYYIQVYCTAIFEWLIRSKTTTQISSDIVRLACDAALEHLSEHYSSMWNKLTAFQKQLLIDLCRGHKPTISSQADGEAYQKQMNEIRLLKEREIVGDDWNTDKEPLFVEWIRKHVL